MLKTNSKGIEVNTKIKVMMLFLKVHFDYTTRVIINLDIVCKIVTGIIQRPE
jgi:hypothetical protein